MCSLSVYNRRACAGVVSASCVSVCGVSKLGSRLRARALCVCVIMCVSLS